MSKDFDSNFGGAKVAVFLGQDLLVNLRDDIDGLQYPNYWDMPGGGREGDETPEETVIRETFEEFGLHVSPQDLVGKRAYQAANGEAVWFFAAHLEARQVDNIVFGDEGQRWALWPVERFLAHPMAVPFLKTRLETYLNG